MEESRNSSVIRVTSQEENVLQIRVNSEQDLSVPRSHTTYVNISSEDNVESTLVCVSPSYSVSAASPVCSSRVSMSPVRSPVQSQSPAPLSPRSQGRVKSHIPVFHPVPVARPRNAVGSREVSPLRFQSLPTAQQVKNETPERGCRTIGKSNIVQPGFLVNKSRVASPNKHVRKGDLVWFNPLASTGALAAAAASSQPENEGVAENPLLIPGEVTEYHPKGNVLILKSHANDEVHTVENNTQNVRKRVGDLRMGPQFIGYPDMICMNDLSEPALIWNVKERYNAGEIYTYVGSILISVNPYKMFDIYGLPIVKKYEGKVLGALPPHLFAISSSAYTRMAKDAAPQVIIISGESGSGKTEATKLIMGYLALVNKSPSNLITEQILEANPLLESFGNAKTGKNDNSSRFGKYLQVYFSTSNTNSSSSQTGGKAQTYTLTPIITGCRITEYLLEKSRIVTHNEHERNYHVFYELLRGLSKEQKEKYGLLSAEKYFYLNQGGNCTIPGKHDAEDFQALLSAMQILGFNNEEINNIFKILAAILHLGNVYFHRKNLKHGVEGVEIGSDVEVQWIGHLLEINPDGIRKSLSSRTTDVRQEKMTTPLTIDQSLDARDAIAKVLYSNLFSWLVNRINKIVFKGDSNSVCINILDIFGFEDFKENNFEQLLINYANESLQHIMNKHIFKLEQQEYQKEKIDWSLISFEDNLPVINLLTKKPVGILHLLDDESNFPKGTDHSFLEKCHYNHALNEHYLRPRMNCNEFGVKHYAGSVLYNVEGFLEKNRDMVRGDVIKLLASSRCAMIARMFGHAVKDASPNVNYYHGPKSPKSQAPTTRFITMKPRAPTVAARFHDNLTVLLESMSKCSPWFVRCIKPNSSKSPMKFDIRVVANQLRYSGILETIRIRKLGYPIRYTFAKFAARYKCLVQNNYSVSNRDLTRLILTQHAGEDYQLGSTKVFLREILEQKLENARYELNHNAAVAIQSAVRGYLARKRYRELVHAVIKIQAYVRMRNAFNRYSKVKRGVIKLQALIRMKREKSRYTALVKRMNRNKDLCVTGVNHLEIPAELAFMMSKIDHEDQVVEFLKLNKSSEFNFEQKNLEAYNFDKYVRVFFKSNFGMRREPIITPFLKDSPEESLTVFKLILRFMNDPNLNGKREVLLMNYIVFKGIQNPNLRDEILVQILNQTKNNENKLNCDRGWVLLAACLSAFQPSDNLYYYLLNYSFNEHAYSSVIQLKLLQMERGDKVEVADVRGGGRVDVRVESWSTVEDVANAVASNMGLGSQAFGLDMRDSELPSYSFVFDHLNHEFSTAYPFKFNLPELYGKRVPVGKQSSMPPPPPPSNKSKSLENLLGAEHKFRNLGLSSSKLNERYHSIDNLDPGRKVSRKASTEYFDLDEEVSGSENEYEKEQVRNSRIGNPRFIKSTASSSIKQRSTGNSVYGSSRMYIDRGGSSTASDVYGMIKSSALSDTSEAPSLASHVRRVRVPSQASDVDQFLDDLFSPVLENLDDLSDARSLITSIKGGTDNGESQSPVPENTTTFLQSAFAQNLQIQQQLIAQNQALQQLLQQTLGGPEQPSERKLITRDSRRGQCSTSAAPLPPSPIPGHRPFIDPYGRAKTVRIGKWRWPPKYDDDCPDEFSAFKQRVEEARKLDSNDGGSSNDSIVWPGDEEEDSKSSSSGENKLIGLVGGKKIARPFGGEVVGKLKLSNEMRMKLEQVTSVRLGKPSSAPKIQMHDHQEQRKIVKKLDDSRRNILEQKLGGIKSMGVVPPPPPPIENPIIPHEIVTRESSYPKTPTSDYSSFDHSNVFLTSFKLKAAPSFRLRKEAFMPNEEVSSKFGEFLKSQVLRDVQNNSPRILEREKRGLQNTGYLGWKEVVEVAKTWELYFWKLFRVQTSRDVSYLAVNSKGIKLVSVLAGGSNQLNVVEFYSWSHIASVSTPKPSVFSLQTHSSSHHQQNFFTPQAEMIRRLCLVFYNSNMDSFKRTSSNLRKQPDSGRNEDVLMVSNNRFIKQQQNSHLNGMVHEPEIRASSGGGPPRNEVHDQRTRQTGFFNRHHHSHHEHR
ncbi:Unconventional myosin-XV [Orchesella cincta]|uniref:Unconventional myosin-XV n=1 Tax=Orchesella cincta TaxID=48709 RepID=A0A1D2MW73_ORCCI|nr:Unconventional myosin-XV [Orchesella cincta]